jgi:hypothetical protein
MSKPYLSLFEDKPLMATCGGRTEPGETERATAHLPTVFDNLYRKLERMYVEQSAQPVRRRSVAIRWLETDELNLENKVNICATRESSSTRENSATEHVSSPTPAAYSRARISIAETNPAIESAWSQGHSNQTKIEP